MKTKIFCQKLGKQAAKVESSPRTTSKIEFAVSWFDERFKIVSVKFSCTTMSSFPNTFTFGSIICLGKNDALKL